MATASAIGRRRAIAIQRIEQRCATLSGGKTLDIPKRSRYGQTMLLVLQLETIADFLEQFEQAALSGYQAMTNAELKVYIQERGLELGKARSKSEFIAILEAADQAAKGDSTHAETL